MADKASELVELTGREKELAVAQVAADETNKARTGKGTRVKVGQTRGKNPRVISFENFDTDIPETLPETADEFIELVGNPSQGVFVSYLIDGYNAAMYAGASDMLSEHVEPNWPDGLAKQFKLAVTNYANACGVSLDEAVATIKPGIAKAFDAKMAAAKA